MSAKNSLKDRIKKPNPTQAFFNSYDTNEDDTSKVVTGENENKVINVDGNKNATKNNINNDDNIKDIDKTYVIDDNNNKDIFVDNDEDDDYLRNLASGKKPTRRKNKKVFTSFYMDPDLALEVDKISSRGEKGDKSKLINMGIRKLLEEYGVIEKK